jgi:hypothetical protein
MSFGIQHGDNYSSQSDRLNPSPPQQKLALASDSSLFLLQLHKDLTHLIKPRILPQLNPRPTAQPATPSQTQTRPTTPEKAPTQATLLYPQGERSSISLSNSNAFRT